MHFRDEHINGCETRGQLKRRFEAEGIQKSTEMDSNPYRASWHELTQSFMVNVQFVFSHRR